MSDEDLKSYREQLKEEMKKKIDLACSIEDEEECVPCNMSAAAGIILTYCDDQKKHDRLYEEFASGKLTIDELLKEVEVPEDIEKWIKETVPTDKTLLDVS